MNSNTRRNLTLIPDGEYVLLDANILIYAIRKVSNQCELLLARCARNEISGIIPAHILAEIMHQLMLAEARDCGWIKGSNPARQLAMLPERIRLLTRYQELIKDITGIGLVIEPLIREDFNMAMAIQQQAGLLTNDALLAATGERLRVTVIATADAAFERVNGISAYYPDDLDLIPS
jgi:predicted nucleic acid-binding protein